MKSSDKCITLKKFKTLFLYVIVGYFNSAFAADKGQKRAIFQFQSTITFRSQNLESGNKFKMSNKNLSKLCYLDLTCMSDKGQKG